MGTPKTMTEGRKRSLANLRPAWKAGESGNPKGRLPATPDVAALARMHTVEALETQLAAMRDPKATWGERLDASEKILNRGWGKPTQPILDTVTVTTDDPRDVIAQQLARIAAARAATADIGEPVSGAVH